MNHKKKALPLSFVIFILAFGFTAEADEGMYLLNKIDQNLMAKMKKMGLELPLEEIYNLEGKGLTNAVVKMGATASFVSPRGLVITNHHVAFGAVQRISTAEKNYIKTGFLARSPEEEVPAPGYEVNVLLSIKDITQEVLSAVKNNMSALERYEAIEKKKKAIISKEESFEDVSCEIGTMNYGMEYYIFSYLKLKDIRTVYVPPLSIGEYGGDFDNWMWPRHTGDFAFMRAYVGPDGKPAPYSQNNVPYKPKSYLKISTRGIKEGDFAMIMGFPGRTYRHVPSFVIESDQEFRYPFQIQTAQDLINIFEEFSIKDKEAAVKLSSTIKGLNNSLKNNQGMLEGLIKTRLLERKRTEEKAFLVFLENNPELGNRYSPLLSEIEALYKEQKKTQEKAALFGWIRRASPMLSYALIINKWSIEKQKKDIDRESGYQKRDLPSLESRLKVAQRSLVPEADRKGLEYFLKKALALPDGQKIQIIENIVSQNMEISKDQAINTFIEQLYSQTKLVSAENRVKMLHLDRKDLLNLNDPFIQFALALEREREHLTKKSQKISGAASRLLPAYLGGIETWKKSSLYPDANGTLRFNFGLVKGYSPRDAVEYHYLTSLTGVIEKHTGEDPFDNPPNLLNIYKQKDISPYMDENINDVPVNFLTTNDSTGGNSGSPVLNGRGELVGLLFDGTYESIYADYYFNPESTRSINVDIRYVLFIAHKVDKALNVLQELTLVE